jgi:hypothetical protein
MDAPGTDSALNDPLDDRPNELLIDTWNDSLIERLAVESGEFDSTRRDPERNCWMAVHRYVHGVLPSEYDIREVPEELYLAVLSRRKQSQQGD